MWWTPGGFKHPDEIDPWKQLSDQIRAEFIGQEQGKYALRLRVREWSIVLDHYEGYARYGRITYTRMRAPYENTDGFSFNILSVWPGWEHFKLFRTLRWPQRQLGDVVIRANDAFKLRTLLANPRLEHLIQTTSLSARFREQVVCRYSTDVLPRDEVLYFESAHFSADVERLSALFDLFAEMLLQLRNIGSASDRAPNVVL